MKQSFLILFCTLISSFCSGQITSYGSVFSSAGLDADRPTVKVNSTFGETFIFSSYSSDGYANQGFQKGDGDLILSVFQPEEKFDISIYPNPTQRYITISSAENIDRILIYNVQGILIKDLSPHIINQIDLLDLKQGIHYIYVQSDNDKYYAGPILKI